MHNRQTFSNLVSAQIKNTALSSTALALRAKQNQLRNEALEQFSNIELARKRASYTRWRGIEAMDKYLVDFEASFMRNGGRVIWAYDAETALQEIEQLLEKSGSEQIHLAKSKHIAEIGLDKVLIQQNRNTIYWNNAAFLNHATKSHRAHPIQESAMLLRNDITSELNQQIKVSINAPDEEIYEDIRQVNEEKVGNLKGAAIFSADYLIAENGIVVCCDSEAGIQRAVNESQLQIILAGIDSVVPAFQDIDLLLSLYSVYGYGMKSVPFQSYYSPRKSENDRDIPIQMVVVLIDNGRSDVLNFNDQRQVLRCIDCGACHFECPVNTISGASVFDHMHESGPNGSTKTSIIKSFSEGRHYSDFCTSCANCTVVCPVQIDLHTQLLRNRRDAVSEGSANTGDKMAWFVWKKAALSRKNMNRQESLKNIALKQFFKSDWGEQRMFPKFESISFNEQWRKMKGIK